MIQTTFIEHKYTTMLSEKCHYICSNKTNYVKQLQTNKHNAQRCSYNAQPIVAKYVCVCSNSYVSLSILHYEFSIIF